MARGVRGSPGRDGRDRRVPASRRVRAARTAARSGRRARGVSHGPGPEPALRCRRPVERTTTIPAAVPAVGRWRSDGSIAAASGDRREIADPRRRGRGRPRGRPRPRRRGSAISRRSPEAAAMLPSDLHRPTAGTAAGIVVVRSTGRLHRSAGSGPGPWLTPRALRPLRAAVRAARTRRDAGTRRSRPSRPGEPRTPRAIPHLQPSSLKTRANGWPGACMWRSRNQPHGVCDAS